MKKLLFLFFANCILLTANCQLNYWQQQVNYIIDVTLNDKEHTLDAFERINYTNNSPDTLYFIWFHLWPNAYKNDKTAFSDQLLENGSTAFYFSNKEQKGYINRLDFKVNDITAATEDHPQHIDIIKVKLPSPLLPKQTIIITTPFHVKLPYNFSRGGHDGESYQVTQWFPKPAVYDTDGWHPMPYLDEGEFYGEFGSFDVSITVPKNYVVAATGELQDENEKQWLKTRSSFTWKPERKKQKTKSGGIKTVVQKFPTSAAEIKMIHFKQDKVHDFAWFADKRFIVSQDTCILSSGKIVTVQTYYTQEEKRIWQNSLNYSKRAIRFYSAQLGEYPYNTVSVVQGPKSFGGGMEYPTITVISPITSPAEFELTLAHEVGHNWLYGILANNERDHPWMDEGINTFYENLYKETYHINSSSPSKDKIYFETAAAEKKDQPVETTSEQFNDDNYGLVAYYKTGEWMQYLKSALGAEAFTKAMQDYYREWQFKHSQPEDFKKAIEKSSRKDLDSIFSLLNKKGILPGSERTGTQFGFLLNKKLYTQYARANPKNVVLFGPALGFNSYDKLMIGGLITNYHLPPSKFQFFLAPMYATGSKKFAGIGFINYSFYPNGLFRKINLSMTASKFSSNEFKKSDGGKIYYGFQKLAPGLRFTLKEKNARNTMNRYIQWKTFFFNEGTYRIRYDTIISPPDTTINQLVNIISENRTLNQLKIVIENYRVLYPYSGELKLEQGKYFVRAAFTGKYFFNYPKGGGLNARFFAGKLFYTSPKTFSKQFATNQYHLNLTGANGYEDYTYSDYFIGRNKFDGLASQQIMIRDGAFKVRTDLLGDKVGKTDNWLMAVNFNSTIIKYVPIRVFADIGTYAEAWDRNSNQDRLLFDAGLQLSILKETVNIYVPLIYSRVFKDYIHSYISYKSKLERFFKTISFSIDISNFTFRKIDRHLSF